MRTPTTIQPIAVSPTSNPKAFAAHPCAPLVVDQHFYLFVSAQSGPLDYFENTDSSSSCCNASMPTWGPSPS